MNILNHFRNSFLQIRLPNTSLLLVITLSLMTAPSASAEDQPEKNGTKKAEAGASTKAEKQPKTKWISLFNGKNLDGWKVPQFGGEGEVHVEKGKPDSGNGRRSDRRHSRRYERFPPDEL